MTDSRSFPDDTGDFTEIPAPSQSGEPTQTTGGQNSKKSQPAGPVSNFKARNFFAGPLGRCIFICLITLILLIPLGFVKDIIYDRMQLQDQALGNIVDSWGGAQAVKGPALIIPYETWTEREVSKPVVMRDNRTEYRTEKVREYNIVYKVVLPAELAFDAELDTEIRYRGIYRQVLYTAPMKISGRFSLPTENDFASNTSRILWDAAWLCVGIPDPKTIAEATPVRWGSGTLAAYKPGTKANALLGPGFHAEVPLNEEAAGTEQVFSFRLALRGSKSLSFTPVGENTAITVKSTWPTPSFQGNLLPVDRVITDQGFTARWAIPNLARSYPQMGDLHDAVYMQKHGESTVAMFTAGVSLHDPVTLYRMARRSMDYSILFIAVTFVALFVFEMVSRRRMHMLQYVMVGLSMSVFYLVLLSLAEHIGFNLAFAAASVITIVMNSVYMGAVLHGWTKGLLMGGLLAIVYCALFSLLRMEDFALLLGTGLVLVMMGALMYVTRKLPQAETLTAG